MLFTYSLELEKEYYHTICQRKLKNNMENLAKMYFYKDNQEEINLIGL
jgi:hypothetical protein